MKECDNMKRKIRTRKMWVPKENGFICGKCGAKGDCTDYKAEAVKGNIPFYWNEKAGEHGKIVCIKCNHWLETKEELEDLIDYKEIQRYGFWLRFASTHFIPCDECQDKLHEALMTSRIKINRTDSLSLTRGDGEVWQFSLSLVFSMLGKYPKYKASLLFIPCEECQKELQKIWENKELHIGNDVKPMVELWRTWEMIED